VPDYLRLRQTFDTAAEQYDRARTGYPPELFDRLAADGLIGPGVRVLEIGCGTGQATVPLASRGCSIVAVELGAAMAAVARRNVDSFGSVDVQVSSFEEWPPPERPFDLVFAANAYHWIDPAVRVAKAARALRPGGALVTVDMRHALGGTVEFFAAAQKCYERFDPSTTPGLVPADDDDLYDGEEPLPGFAAPSFWRLHVDVPYTTSEYIDLLLTYSGHIALPPDNLRGLLDCIGTLIDRDHGGRIVKRYVIRTRVARRL